MIKHKIILICLVSVMMFYKKLVTSSNGLLLFDKVWELPWEEQNQNFPRALQFWGSIILPWQEQLRLH